MTAAATTWRPVGSPALGFALGERTEVVDGWVTRGLRVPDGLDGPRGILQGGFATAVGLLAARLADDFGAPLTSVRSRLHAPTPLGSELTVALRPGDGVAVHEVELRDADRLLVSSRIELAGHDPAPRTGDLLELADAPLPEVDADFDYPHCWLCGSAPSHPHAQLLPMRRRGETTIVPWVADEALADDRGVVDPLVVAAALDCPGPAAAHRVLRDAGFGGCLLGGMEVRPYRDVPAYEPLRLVGRLDALDGRKVRVRVAIVDEERTVYAIGSSLHVAVAEMPG